MVHKKFLKKPGKQKVGLPVAPHGVGGGEIKIKFRQKHLLRCALEKNSKRSSPAGKVRRRPPPNIKKWGLW